jgi:hypothetical protein
MSLNFQIFKREISIEAAFKSATSMETKKRKP